MISAAQALHFGLSSPSAPVFLLDPFWDLLVIYNNRTASLQTQTSRLHSGREPSAGAKSHIPPSPPIPPTPAFSKAPPPYTITVCPSLSLFLFLLSKKKIFFLRRNGRNVDVCVTLEWRQFTFCHELGTVYVVLPQAFCSIALCLNNKAPRETQ